MLQRIGWWLPDAKGGEMGKVGKGYLKVQTCSHGNKLLIGM